MSDLAPSLEIFKQLAVSNAPKKGDVYAHDDSHDQLAYYEFTSDVGDVVYILNGIPYRIKLPDAVEWVRTYDRRYVRKLTEEEIAMLKLAGTI